jgi:hypothetical protein
MTIDRYTKAVLTVIAGCLLFQCVMAAGRVVEAQALDRTNAGVLVPAQKVVIVGWGDMAISRETPLPVAIEAAQPVPVKLGYDNGNDGHSMPVVITGIKRAGPWDSIHASIDPQSMGEFPGAVKR